MTLHPSGIQHGPHPGLAEKSIGMTETQELAVMRDTFHPLKLTTFANALDDGSTAILVRGRRRSGAVRRPPGGPTSHF